MSGVDQIMRLADEWYAHGQTSHSGIDEKYAALRAAVERLSVKAEPVAWMALVDGVAVQTAISRDQLVNSYSHVVPLYAKP